MPRLGLDLDFQALVHRVQGSGHAVEAGRHLAELVLGINLDAGGELPQLDLGQALAKPAERTDHIQVTGVEHDHRPGDGQRHHGELEQVQDSRQARQVLLDGQHKPVDRLDKIARRLQRIIHWQGRLCQRLPALLFPE